jgi:hypothetical protein
MNHYHYHYHRRTLTIGWVIVGLFMAGLAVTALKLIIALMVVGAMFGAMFR